MSEAVKVIGKCECGAALKQRVKDHIEYRPWWEAPFGKAGHAHAVVS